MIDFPVHDGVLRATAEWIAELRPWVSFWTLTFEDPVSDDFAAREFRRLVHYLNKRLFGPEYMRRFGISAFSVVCALEYQRRDVPHFHAIVDQPIDYGLIRSFWNHHGFSYFERIRDTVDCAYYVTKYVLKSGRVDVVLSKRRYSGRGIRHDR